jgi:hypothetical protein
MSIFGQVWLWSLLAFVIGALLSWLVLVLPLHKHIRRLESRLATANVKTSRAPAQPVQTTNTAYLAQPTLVEPAVHGYAQQEHYAEPEPGQRYTVDEAYPEQAVGEPELEAWTEEPVAEYEPVPEPEPAEPPANEYVRHPELEPATAEYRLEPHWFERDLVPERSPFEEPSIPEDLEEPEITEETPADASGSEENQGGLPVAAETPIDSTQMLPKRQRRESPRGGFDPPRPIQPSMRAIERREPNSDLSGAYSGSLFEPSVQPGQYGLPPAPEPPPARDQVPVDSVPPGPFGPGSAMPRPGGGRPSIEFAVKASVTALRYCTEDSPQFSRMVAEVWFRTQADAERVGFRALT